MAGTRRRRRWPRAPWASRPRVPHGPQLPVEAGPLGRGDRRCSGAAKAGRGVAIVRARRRDSTWSALYELQPRSAVPSRGRRSSPCPTARTRAGRRDPPPRPGGAPTSTPRCRAARSVAQHHGPAVVACGCPACCELDRATLEERLAAYADPAWRDKALVQLRGGPVAARAGTAGRLASSGAHPELVGTRSPQVAAERGVRPLDSCSTSRSPTGWRRGSSSPMANDDEPEVRRDPAARGRRARPVRRRGAPRRRSATPSCPPTCSAVGARPGRPALERPSTSSRASWPTCSASTAGATWPRAPTPTSWSSIPTPSAPARPPGPGLPGGRRAAARRRPHRHRPHPRERHADHPGRQVPRRRPRRGARPGHPRQRPPGGRSVTIDEQTDVAEGEDDVFAAKNRLSGIGLVRDPIPKLHELPAQCPVHHGSVSGQFGILGPRQRALPRGRAGARCSGSRRSEEGYRDPATLLQLDVLDKPSAASSGARSSRWTRPSTAATGR